MHDIEAAAKNSVDRCPHCGNETGLELSPQFRYRCRICGGPRVPMTGAHAARSGREAVHLATAKRASRWEIFFKVLWVLSGVVGGITFIATFLMLLLFSGLGSAWASLLIFGAVPLLAAFWARHRARQSANTSRDALEQAWTSVAHEVLEHTDGELTAGDLAAKLLTGEQHADELLARLNVDDEVRSRVTDGGEVVYSVRGQKRLRVPIEPVAGGTELGLDNTVELEQAAEPPRERSE